MLKHNSRDVIYNEPKHIYTKRLIAAIPDVNPLIREEKRLNRIKISQEYAQLESVYYDKDGKVFDLEKVNGSEDHYIAFRSGGK